MDHSISPCRDQQSTTVEKGCSCRKAELVASREMSGNSADETDE